MNKPIKPNITIPESFAKNGVKTDFDSDLIAEGFDNLKPDVLAGDNLNKFIDDTYQGLNYGMAAADAINLINEGETLTVVDGQLTSGASGGGLEIGDIGIAPLGIDETKNKRRYLNGQIVIQEQYIQFTNKLKAAINLYPTLSCSEDEWQATALLTVGGQVGKFVVDDDAGTIRLPKIIMPIQGLTDLSKLAEIVEAGLPNITGETGHTLGTDSAGAFYEVESGGYNGGTTATTKNHFDASLSNPIYGNSDTVQQEQIQYPYFIQVATGAETKEDFENEHLLNIPFFIGYSQYFENAPYNLSWAVGGSTLTRAVHPAYYDALLIELNADIEVGTTQNNYTKRGLPVKLATDSYTDYDFVVNTADETFRLPLLNGSESLIDATIINKTESWGTTFKIERNAYLFFGAFSETFNDDFRIELSTDNGTNWATRYLFDSSTNYMLSTLIKADTLVRTSGGSASYPREIHIIYAQGNGSLYFYVGEDAQNTTLVNAGRIEETLSTKVNTNANNLTADGKSLISGYSMPSDRYIDLTLGASGTEYTAPANGWICVGKKSTNSSTPQWIAIKNITKNYEIEGMAFYGISSNLLLPVTKGDVFIVSYTMADITNYFKFIYAEGEA